MVNEGLRCGGLHLVSSKGHGKSFLMFAIADYVRSLPDSRVIIFDGSEAFLYKYSQIPVFNVNECDISTTSQKHTLEFEHYSLNNWQLVKTALENHQDILFRLKSRKPSKRGYFIRTVINHLDEIQRQQREINETHEPNKSISYFLDEAQDAFCTRSTMRTEAETFLCVFNEARNNRESIFSSSQRLNDFSKTIRTKQTYIIGKIAIEDVNPQLRRLEKQYNINLTEMSLRNWFFNGSVFVSPEFKQNKKPFIINAEVRKTYSTPAHYKMVPPSDKPKSLLKRIINALTNNSQNASNDQQSEDSEDEKENKEMDDMFLLDPLNP